MYKNPFNYIGAKYKLLPQILPLFPRNIDTFIDLFGGGGELTFNVRAKQHIYNEKCEPLVNILKELDDNFLQEVENTIKKWNLNKTSKQEFLLLRKFYNENLHSLSARDKAVILYCLSTHAFNYQIAFNSSGEYNMTSGAGRSYFSPQLKKRLKDYIEIKNKTDILFMSKDFLDVNIKELATPNDGFIYVDPPYLITTGAYERDYFCKWSVQYEVALLNYLDNLNVMGYRWALSNVLEHKGKSNDILKDWCNKYNVHYLNADYKNCNYQTNSRIANSSREVLIVNY